MSQVTSIPKSNRLERRKVVARLLADDELVGIGPAIRPDRHRFAAENQFGTAPAKIAPAAQHRLRDSACRCPIPPLHGMYGAAVPDPFAVDQEAIDRPGKGGCVAPEDRIIARQFQPQGRKMPAELRHTFQCRYSHQLDRFSHTL